MKSILDLENLINTYPKEHQEHSRQYLESIKFKNLLSARKTSIRLNIPFGRVSDWFYANNKPFPIRAILKAKENKWVPLFPSPKLAYLVGYNTGDGHISPGLLHLDFCSKYKEILLKIGNEIMDLFKIVLNLDKIIYKSTNVYHLQISNTVLARVFYAIGTPKGNKTKTPFLIPDWIYYPEAYDCSSEIGTEIQKAYLQGLNDAELKKPYENSKDYNSLTQLRLQMYKIKELKSNHIKFLNQVCILYNRFGIQMKLNKIKYDGNKIVGELEIPANLQNILKFTANVGFRFHTERLEACGIYVDKTIKALERIETYEKAMKLLNRTNIPYSKVANEVNVDDESVRLWVKTNRKPHLFDDKEEIKRYLPIVMKRLNNSNQ